jgi:hypothetical protein
MYEGIKDIRLSLDGDLVLDRGDLAITSGLDWYRREVNKRLRSGKDWYYHPTLGADLHRFVGSMNSRDTGRRMKDAILRSLSIDNIHFPADLQVDIVPTSLHEVSVIITLLAEGNREVVGHKVVDFNTGFVVPVSDPPPQQKTPVKSPHSRTENKYQKSIGGF